MRKIFIDCGYYRGKAITLFKKKEEYDESFEIFAFDPNRFSEERLQAIESSGVNFINKAVWTHDGKITFYASGRRHGQANSIFKNPKKPRRERHRTVECIDFGKWIKDNFSPDDHIIVKMDIEGAEYEILQKMLEDGSIHYVNQMYVEYHYARREDEVSKDDFLTLRKKLRSETKVEFKKAIEW
jgi:FkbM family methyltransferase